MPTIATVPARYSHTARALHWAMAQGLLGLVAAGAWMVDLPFSPQRLKLYNWHKWAGIVMLGLLLARLLWRLTHRPPAPLPMPAAQAALAHAVHALLYLLMLAIPLMGWAYSSAAGFPVVLFGLWPLPDWVGKDPALAEALKPWHGRLAWALVALVALHVLGALKHHFWNRDGLLARMAWSFRR